MKSAILASSFLVLSSLHSLAGTPEVEITPAPAATADSGWEFLLAVYGPAMGLDGRVGIGPIVGDVDVPFSDILDDLDGGLFAALEARRDRWSITGDFFWLKLSDSSNPTPNSYLGFKQEQLSATVLLGYALVENENTTLDFVAGAALTSLDMDLDLYTPRLPVTTRAFSGSETWVDPIFGLRLRHKLSDRWTVFATGVYGGFGVGSDEYWQALAGVSYDLTESCAIAVAYRAFAIDYQDASFLYDTTTSGLNIRLIFRF